MPDFSRRTVIVTGGANGIGAAVARAFDAQGARVAILDLDGEAAAAVAGDLRNSGLAQPVDVRQRASVERAFATAIEALGGLDILIANAGVSTMRKATDLTDEDWDFNFGVNARRVFLTNQTACRHFLARGTLGQQICRARLDPGART